jgi:hypothetical protein
MGKVEAFATDTLHVNWNRIERQVQISKVLKFEAFATDTLHVNWSQVQISKVLKYQTWIKL